MSDEPTKSQSETQQQTLVLIDGHALAYRAYFALANTGFQTRDGEPTHAVYGFALMLLAVWEEYNPEYLAVTFDTGDTFRHKQYAEYKATREKMPDDLGQQIGRIEQLASAFNFPVFTVENFEADDVLGTLAHQASERGVQTIIVTGDRDAFQLVAPKINVLISGRSFSDRELYDEARVEARYGLPPATDIWYRTMDVKDTVVHPDQGERSDFQGAIPMCGFGPGAWILAVHDLYGP